ncbi:MAG: hypothetical protein KJ709_05115 [Nanoarchaeota archaeon]|nr:hypothetical protein [Nanoarchaeota archaeon]
MNPLEIKILLDKQELDEEIGPRYFDKHRIFKVKKLSEAMDMAVRCFEAYELPEDIKDAQELALELERLSEFYEGRSDSAPDDIGISRINQRKRAISGVLLTLGENRTEVIGKGYEVTAKAHPAHFLANKVVKMVFKTKNVKLVLDYVYWMKEFQKRFQSISPRFKLLEYEIKVHPHLPKPGDPSRKVFKVYMIQERVDERFLLDNLLKTIDDDQCLKIYQGLMEFYFLLIKYNLSSEIRVSTDVRISNYVYYQEMYYYLDFHTPLILKKGARFEPVMSFWWACQKGRLFSLIYPISLRTYVDENFLPKEIMRRLINWTYFSYPNRSKRFRSEILTFAKGLIQASDLPQTIKKKMLKGLKIRRTTFYSYKGTWPNG